MSDETSEPNDNDEPEENVDPDLNVDPAVWERLRGGSSTPADELTKLKYWRAIANSYQGFERVAELNEEIADLEANG